MTRLAESGSSTDDHVRCASGRHHGCPCQACGAGWTTQRQEDLDSARAALAECEAEAEYWRDRISKIERDMRTMPERLIDILRRA